MTFDEWTTEAHRSLETWDPDPAVRPAAVMARPEPVAVDLSPVDGRPPASTRRWLLSAVAAAAVVVAAAAAAMAIRPADTDVAVRPQATPTSTVATETSAPASTEPVASEPAVSPSAARFDCSAAGEGGAPTSVFDDSPDVAEWRVDDMPFSSPTSGAVTAVRGTLVEAEAEDVAGTTARAETFVAAVAPGWTCTVWSPQIDTADPTQPGAIVDEDDVVTNRLGGRCYVPDATTTPGSVWGVDPGLAAALDQVEGLTDWTVILADGGRNGQGDGRLWMEFSFEADPSAGDTGDAGRVLADLTTAVTAAGTTAGVPTDCSIH